VRAALDYAIGEALDRGTAADCRSFFASCGIPVPLRGLDNRSPGGRVLIGPFGLA
jgi:hypothetical protein